MQSAQSRDKITVLVLLAASTTFALLARGLGPLADPVDIAPESSRFLLAGALACSLIAVLMLLSPGKSHRSLRATLKDTWPQLAGLGALVAGYALALPMLGFFIATSLFLVTGYLLLGERRWWSLLILCLPVAALLQLLMHGMFGIKMAVPFMQALALAG